HSTLDFREVIHIVQEILLNLVGAKSFSILLLDENTKELRAVACDGEDAFPGIETLSTRLGEGVIGTVASRAESFYLNDGTVSLERDRKSTRLNSSHGSISYAVFSLKKKTPL